MALLSPLLADLYAKGYDLLPLIQMEQAALRQAQAALVARGITPTQANLLQGADEVLRAHATSEAEVFRNLHEAYHFTKESLATAEVDDLSLVASHLARCVQSLEFLHVALAARNRGGADASPARLDDARQGATLARAKTEVVAAYTEVLHAALELTDRGVIAVQAAADKLKSLTDWPCGPIQAIHEQALQVARERHAQKLGEYRVMGVPDRPGMRG